MSKHPKPNSPNANVWNMNENQPYAKRSVGSIFYVVLLFAASALTIYWYLGQEENPTGEASEAVIAAGQGNPSRVGLDDLTDNALEFVTGGTNDLSAGQAALLLEEQAQAIANSEPQYENSVREIINSKVLTPNGEKVGKVHDILINKETGEAKAIIINDKDNGYYSNELKKLSFNKVINQSSDGQVLTSLTDDQFDDKSPFQYKTQNDQYISLRNLKDAQILDDKGNVAGKMIAVIHQNAETQGLYFSLSPTLAPDKEDRRFGLPFEAVNLIKNNDGYDIKLTKKQTENIAKHLFE